MAKPVKKLSKKTHPTTAGIVQDALEENAWALLTNLRTIFIDLLMLSSFVDRANILIDQSAVNIAPCTNISSESPPMGYRMKARPRLG